MHDYLPVDFIEYAWITFFLVWVISALKVKASVKRQSIASRLEQGLPVTTAFCLIFSPNMWPHWLRLRFFSQSDTALVWIGVALTALGMGFATLARLWIGTNWSGTITIKDRHELVQGGPYRIVRHPIYAGMLLAYLGTAIVHGEIRGLIGLLLLALGFGLKLRMEEAFMIQQFGSAYNDYKQRVKALVPFLI
jgi:protein-S-isoprenylcysteine O-methyltransferase